MDPEAQTVTPSPDEPLPTADLAAQLSDVVTRTDENAVYTYVSPSSERVYGFAPEEMVGRPALQFIHPDDVEAHRGLRAALAAGADEQVIERRARRADGTWVWVEARARALRDDAGRMVGLQTAARDISDRRAAEEARRIADAQFRTAFDDALVGIALVGLDGRMLRVNEALCQIVGHPQEQLSSLRFQDITHPDDLDADLALLAETLAGERRGYQMEKRYLRPDGEVVWTLLSVSLVRDPHGEPSHFISQVLDISERRRLEAELRRLATRDHLTGLFNRRHFEEELAGELRLIRRHGGAATLLFLDLDDFKAVNDEHGHHVGDELLKHVAGVLSGRLRETDVIARLGGDEFAVLLRLTGADGAAKVVASLHAELDARPFAAGDERLRPGASIGIAELGPDLDVDAALQRADQAMYRVKRERR